MSPGHHFFRSFWFWLCLVALLSACAAGTQPDSGDASNRKTETARPEQRLFIEQNPTRISQIDALQLTTRMATPAEIPEETYKSWLFFPAEGAGSLALGLVAPPMYASALVVGGVLLVPLGTYGYVHEKRIWNTINAVLVNAEFTRLIDTAMTERLHAIFSTAPAPPCKVEIVVQAFGIVKTETLQRHCFIVAADFILTRENAVSHRDSLLLTVAGRSTDAPPPQCASLEIFAENQGRLVATTLAEYAEVLAAMATERIIRESPP